MPEMLTTIEVSALASAIFFDQCRKEQPRHPGHTYRLLETVFGFTGFPYSDSYGLNKDRLIFASQLGFIRDFFFFFTGTVL